MIVDDNRLTNDAREPVSGATSFPANDLRVFIAALSRLGYKRQPLLEAAGLRDSMLDDPDVRIPCEMFGAVIGRAMQERPMKNLGVRIAAETPIGAFPLLDYLVMTCNTVGEGIKQLSQYLRLVETPCSLEIFEQENPIRVVVWAGISLSVEFAVTLDILHLREETNGLFQPDWASFSHKPDDVSEIERTLGCAVRAEAAWSGFALSRQAWQLPLRRRDPVLRDLLEKQANEIVARIPVSDGAHFDVRRALARRIAGGDTRIESVARELATTERTLQRRLEAAGFSYQDLLEATRREAAEKYLTDLSLSIAEVAFLLGYSEPSAFHRAFKRWHEITPQAFRQKQNPTKSAAGMPR